MKSGSLVLACILVAATSSLAFSQEKATGPVKNAEQAIAETARLLELTVPTSGFQEPMPFVRFLAKLEALLPKDRKRTIRLDAMGLGKDYAGIAAAPVQLPPVPKQMSLGTVMRLAIGQVNGNIDLDHDFRPAGVVITLPRLTYREVIYEVRDVIEQMPFLVPELRRQHAYQLQLGKEMPSIARVLPNDRGDVLGGVDPADGKALLMHWLTKVELPSEATVQLQNETRLRVYAARRQHAQIAELLFSLRRTADLHVVMNARLYELDRALYIKHVARLFPSDPDTGERPAVLAIDGATIKIIAKQKLLLQSDDLKLRPDQRSTFLAMHNVVRYADGSRIEKDQVRKSASVLSGLSFAVRPLVSPDRRHLRLQIHQEVAELIAIDKIRKRELFTGNELEIEMPRLRRSTLSGTVDVPDGDPFVMPVDYRPPGKGNEDKVWIMVARPQIWIQEEQDQIKAGNIAPVKPGNIEPSEFDWDGPTSKEEDPPPPPPLPWNDDVKQVLQAILTDVLTNPDLKDMRASYNISKNRIFSLLDGEKCGWPKEFAPETHGYALMRGEPGPFDRPRRITGVRIDRFDMQQNQPDIKGRLHITIVDAGGNVGGGATWLHYRPARDGKRWTLQDL